MISLPPVETAQLQTNHLERSFFNRVSRLIQTFRFNFSWSQLNRAGFDLSCAVLLIRHWGIKPQLAGLLGLLIPLSALWLVAPHQPRLPNNQKALVATQIQPTTNQNTDSNQDNKDLVANQNSSTNTTEASLVSSVTSNNANSAEINKTYRYHLTLAQGFLEKAVQLSQQTAAQQTDADREKIIANIDKAFSSANQAIDLDSTLGSGYLIRARIYKTASVYQPELADYAQQDLEIARALGINGEDIENSNPLDLLPTQQASTPSKITIADPEEKQASTITTNSTNNTTSNQTTFQPGQSEKFVSYPDLKTNQTIEITSDSANIFYLRSRQDGRGFTIATKQQLTQETVAEWMIVEN